MRAGVNGGEMLGPIAKICISVPVTMSDRIWGQENAS